MKHVNLEVFGGIAAQQRQHMEISDQCNVHDLLVLLEMEKRLPKKFGKGKGFSEFIVFVNGRNVMVGERVNSILDEDDNVVVIPAMAGG
jgi:molybdopterin converting factor small subunit